MSNASAQPLAVRCFFENVNGACLDEGGVCLRDADCPGSECVPGFSVTDFQVTLTAGQPIEWRAGLGLEVLPAPGNAGVIPPVAQDPFTGAMRCVVVDESTGLPPVTAGPSRNDLEGVATIERLGELAVEIARYRAIGLPSMSNDGDATLEIGNEYVPCPNVLSLNHLSEAVLEPIATDTIVRTELTLLPCAVDYLTGSGAPVSDVIHFSIYNEFEQRVGASARMTALLSTRLGDLNPTIFNVGVQGTLAAQTRIQSVATGMVGFATRILDDSGAPVATPVFNLLHAGVRGPAPDLIILAQP